MRTLLRKLRRPDFTDEEWRLLYVIVADVDGRDWDEIISRTPDHLPKWGEGGRTRVINLAKKLRGITHGA